MRLGHSWHLTQSQETFCVFSGEGSNSQEEQLCTALVNQLNKFADKETLIQFLRCFLLESNASSVRWQAHCLALHIYRSVSFILVQFRDCPFFVF